MANNSRFHISPSITFKEVDFSTAVPSSTAQRTKLGIVGEFPFGPAFKKVRFSDYNTFSACMGGLNPCYYPNTQQLKYEASYVAKEFLSEANELYVSRVLGLSGSDMGDAYSITFGSSLDPSTIETVYTSGFTATIVFNNGSVTSATFSDPVTQDLYDNGQISPTIFKNGALLTGESVTISNTFYGDCEAYDGARFTSTVTNVDETYICITGTTITSTGGTTTTTVQECVVIYGAGSITYDSTFVISVVNPIALINQSNSQITMVNSGILILTGGEIEHFADGSLIITDGTINLPNGDVISGGTYKICNLESNDAIYLCDDGYTINGDNIVITTGSTVVTIPTLTTGSTTTVAQIPSGIKTVELSGNVTTLTGNSYTDIDGTIVATLRSYASYDSDEILNFLVKGNVLSISSLDGGKIEPYDDFKISGIKTDGSPFSYVVSFDRNKKSYIGRVFGKNPQLCCGTNTELFIEDLFIEMYENMVLQGKIDCIKPTVCYNSVLNDYKEGWKDAVTPWVVSEVRGDKVFRLFRFHTFSSGNAANEQIKISISNIRPDTGYFDVEIRSFNDTDKRPVFLERYSRVSMNERDNNYIARAIGTLDGTYEQRSKYVLLEIAQDCVAESFPAGFEGYPVKDFNGCKSPTIVYKTEYVLSDKIRNIYLGISDTVGIEKDLFKYLGKPFNATEWSGRTDGYHLDVQASGVTVVNAENIVVFQTSDDEFKNESDLVGTGFEKIYGRKFTFVPYGGYDGWDIHRPNRSNTDTYKLGGLNATKGLTSDAFDSYTLIDGTQGLTSDYYAFLEGILTFKNPEDVKINVFTTPTLNTLEHSDLIEETIEMIESDRCDAFYVINSRDYNDAFDPFTPDDLANRLDGLYDTSWAATYAYSGRLYDNENNTSVWVSPVSQVVKVYAQNDRIAAPWFAPAGINRGLTNYTNLRYKPTQDDRDTLADGRVNSLFTDKGNVYIWGNRTLQVDNNDSALNLVSVRRMLIYLRQRLADVSLQLLFEQNDARVRSQARTLINPILQNLRDERGLLNYDLQISSAINDLNTQALNIKIVIIPARDVKNIEFTFELTRAGADFNNI